MLRDSLWRRTSFYSMQCNMSELYVIFMSEVFNSWPISLEMSFRIKYVLRMIHCCPRTRTRYTHIRICICRSHEERTCDWIYVRDISRKSDRGFCRLRVANPWRTLHNGRAQVRSRAIKNGPPRFRAWIIPPWANWNCRHDFRIYIAKLSSFVMRGLAPTRVQYFGLREILRLRN